MSAAIFVLLAVFGLLLVVLFVGGVMAMASRADDLMNELDDKEGN